MRVTQSLPMMLVSTRGISPPPRAPSDAPSHALWRLFGMSRSGPWLCAWIALSGGRGSPIEQVFTSTSAELVGRLKAFPHEKLVQLQCYSPRDFEGAWDCRRVHSVWIAKRGAWPIVLFTDDTGQDFIIEGGEEISAPLDVDPQSRRLVSHVDSSR